LPRNFLLHAGSTVARSLSVRKRDTLKSFHKQKRNRDDTDNRHSKTSIKNCSHLLPPLKCRRNSWPRFVFLRIVTSLLLCFLTSPYFNFRSPTRHSPSLLPSVPPQSSHPSR